MPIRKPKTEKEAWRMVFTGWRYLLMNKVETITDFVKKSIYWPLTIYMLFGGAIFAYKYSVADMFQIEKATPIGQVQHTNFSIMPTAFAQQDGTRVPIKWNGQLWGYEDTNFEAKVLKDKPYILVYDKITNQVWNVYFSTDIKKQMK